MQEVFERPATMVNDWYFGVPVIDFVRKIYKGIFDEEIMN